MEKHKVSTFLRIALQGLALLAATAVHADVIFNVDTLADQIDDNLGDGRCHTSANRCSLRAATMQANHLDSAGLTVIQVPAGTYLLALAPSGIGSEADGDLDLVTPPVAGQTVSIIGAGAARTIIDADHLDRVLAVDSGCTVHVSGVTIRNGTRGGNSLGGGISNRGDLTISDSVIEGNRADEGGGIDSSGALTILRSTVHANFALYGGGMYVYGDTRVRDSTIDGNIASPGSGGAIFNANELRMVNSTLSHNAADTDGGAIYSNYRTSLFSSSIVANDADHDRDELGGNGGGIYAEAAAGSQFIILNVLFSYNTVERAPIFNDCIGAIEAFGWNLFGDASGCAIDGPWGLVSADSIGPLQNNGGPTWTHALLPGSEAIDNPAAGTGCVDDEGEDMPTDQRGAARVTGSRCDIGAFEYGSVVDSIFSSGFD